MLDINDKLKKSFLNEIDRFNFFKDVEIIPTIIEIENHINKIYNINFPVNKIFSVDSNFLDNFNREVKLINNNEILFPFFNNTQYWVKAKLTNKKLFLSYLYNTKIINSFTFISINKSFYDTIYDIEISDNGKFYEIRILKIDN